MAGGRLGAGACGRCADTLCRSNRRGRSAGAVPGSGQGYAHCPFPAVRRAEGDLLGFQAPGRWLFVVALGFLLWRALSLLSDAAAERGAPRALGLLVPGLFGAWLLYLWQVGVTGFGVPSEIGRANV